MNECKHPSGKCNNPDDCAVHVCMSTLRESDDPTTRYLAANVADRWRSGVMEALPAMRAYANANPPHYMGDARQDPHGVHAWLHKYDPSGRKQCGECHLQPGERCDVCGALQGT